MIMMVTLNCRSVANKRLSIADFIISRDVDIMALTKTWLGNDNDKQINRFCMIWYHLGTTYYRFNDPQVAEVEALRCFSKAI